LVEAGRLMLALRALRPGFWLVFWREIGWLRRRPFLLAFVTIVPICLMAVLISVFSAGLATRLPIAVLDLDSPIFPHNHTDSRRNAG
jgi:ABC-2 type transport system permease protein